MAYDEIVHPVTTTLSFGSVITLAYPSGRDSTDYAAAGGHEIFSIAHERLQFSAGHFTIVFGGADIQITLASTTVFVSGEDLYIQLDRAVADADARIEALEADMALKLDVSAYTGATVLSRLLGVDGPGSLLDADLLDGQNSSAFATAAQGTLAATALQPGGNVSALTNDANYVTTATYTAADVLAKLLTVDGAGSGLDADRLDGVTSASFVRSDAAAAQTISVGAGDFVVSQSTGGVSNVIWWDTDVQKLYLGTAGAGSAIIEPRANITASGFDLSMRDLTASRRVNAKGWVSHANRAALVTYAGANTITAGELHQADGIFYIGDSGSSAFSDLPNLSPVAPYHFDQWGIVRETNTGQSTSAQDNATRMQAALDWLGDNGGGTIHAGGGVISFKSTVYWGDKAPVVVQGNGRGVPAAGKSTTRQTPGTRFLWGGSAGSRGLVITGDRTDTSGTVDEERAGGSGILDCFIDGGEVGTRTTAEGGPMLSLISVNDPQVRVLIGYAPGGCFETNTLVNGLSSGAEDTQRGMIDVETTDVNTTSEPWWHCLFTGQDSRNANSSLIPSIKLKLAPEFKSVAVHFEFMDGSRVEFLHASRRTTAVAKTAADLATTANITLSAEQTIDGTLTSASRVLVKNQTATEENGVYTTGAGAWTRVADMNDASEFTKAKVAVTSGTANGGKTFIQTATVATVDTDPVTWEEDFGGKIIVHADDTLATYHGGAYTSQGHCRRVTFDYVQATEGLIAHATLFGSSSSGPNIVKHYSRGNGAPAMTIEAGATMRYWDENVGLYAPTITPAYTAAQIADIADPVNTDGKVEGLTVYDTTNRRIMIARGSAASGNWDVADGSVSVTPS